MPIVSNPMFSTCLTPQGYTLVTTTSTSAAEPDLVLTQMLYLTELVSTVTNTMITEHFNAKDLTLLHVRGLEKPTYEDQEDPEGEFGEDGTRKKKRVRVAPGFPTTAHVAASKLGWLPGVKESQKKYGTYLPNRLLRMSAEAAVRTLRSTSRRYLITQALLDHPDQASAITYLLDTYAIDVEKAELDNRRRAIRNWTKVQGQAPESMLHMEKPPVCNNVVLTSATDHQWQTLSNDEREFTWQVTVPTCKKPQKANDYVKVCLHFSLPEYIDPDVHVHTPDIRLGLAKVLDQKRARAGGGGCALPAPNADNAKRIELDLTYSFEVPEIPAASKRKNEPAIAFDWGSSRSVLTAVAGHSKKGKLVVDSQPLFFDIRSIAGRLEALKEQQNALSAKIHYWQKLMVNQFDTTELAKLEGLVTAGMWQRRMVNEKRENLGEHLAHVIAIWAVRQVVTVGAKTVYVENLKSLSFDSWMPWSEVVTDALRGKIFGYIQDWCLRVGVKLELVSPYNTSVTCSRCLGTMSFFKHSDLKKEGHIWAHCHVCGYTVHRDYNGAVNILSRGLFQTKKDKKFRKVSRFSKAYKSTKKLPGAEARKKAGPTPKQTRPLCTKKTIINSKVSRSYKYPRKWRLLGNRCSPRQAVQVEALGLFPYVTPNHFLPIQV